MFDAGSELPPSGIEGETLSPKAYAYHLANKEGFGSWNAYIAEHGIPLVDNWDF